MAATSRSHGATGHPTPAGSNKKIDYAISRIGAINTFLTQGFDEPSTLEETIAAMGDLVSERESVDRRRPPRKDRRKTDAE